MTTYRVAARGNRTKQKMNGESNTTAIIIVLAVLVLILVGVVLLIRFIVKRILSMFRRLSSRRHERRRKEKDHQRSRDVSNSLNYEVPTLSPEVSSRKKPVRKGQQPDSSQASHPRQFSRNEQGKDAGREAKTRRSGRTSGWIPKDANARIGGRDIGGMVYVGKGPRTSRGGDQDNAFIDSRKNVTRRGGDYEGQGLHYWPNYSTIDARARTTYLDWLSSGRSDTRYDIGYVFLYFYGLERRVFVDKADAQERRDIVAEVDRILEIYGHNHSLRRYLGAFIDAARLRDSNDDFQPVFEYEGYEVPPSVLLTVGRMAARGEPLTADWLLSWYLCHPETRLRTPAKRAFAEFTEYFRYLFDGQFPKGLKLRVPKRRLKLMYHASSGNFAIDFGENLGEVPDVSSLKSPLSTARAISEKASDGLDKYSRYLGRNPEGRGTIEAHALLPEAIWTLFPCPEKEALRNWVAVQVEAGGLVPVEDVIERLEGARPDRIGKRQLIGVADALARLGVGMAPDPRFALRQPRYGEPVVLFDLPSGTLTIESPSEGYRGAILSLAVETLVAHADGRIDDSEREHMAAQVDADQNVSDAERARLHANLSWMAAVPPDMSMLRSRMRNATESVRSALGQLAVVAAGADGTIDPEEIRTVERLYTAMGLERERVYTDLHALTATPEPITVRPADLTSQAFAIPSPPAGTVTLDAARVSAVMADTVRVSQVLGNIFSDVEDDDEEVVDDRVSDADDRLNGLDAAHGAVASVLITRHRWTEEEVSALADAHQLMVDGALETINEWAFENLGDALVEQYDGYEINGDLAQELMR